MTTLKVGDKAPNFFRFRPKWHNSHKLADYKEKKKKKKKKKKTSFLLSRQVHQAVSRSLRFKRIILLVFQANNYALFRRKVLIVRKAQRNLLKKYELPFPLLADEEINQ